jgi:predicted kinase
VARLLHLNGPPGVGKSSVARAYAADHPGALLLDADVVVSMISGWRDAFWETLHVARRLAAAMAREHLVAGADVVLPQLVTRDDEIAPYLAAVEDAGAGYVEVVLLADPDTTVSRFQARAADEREPIGRHVGSVVAAGGGPELLATIRGDLLTYLEGRGSSYLAIDTSTSIPAEVYAELRSLLDGAAQ